MVAEQAIGKSIGDGRDVFAVELHEVVVVAVLAENILAVIAAIVDVVILARFEWCEFLHLLGPDRTGLLREDLSGLKVMILYFRSIGANDTRERKSIWAQTG